MNLPARGRAVGKVILLGEHAVVYGRPALAAGLGIGLEVEVREGEGPVVESDVEDDGRARRLVEEAATIVGLEASRLVVRVRSELPAGAGLGSSAALSIAVLRALARAAGRRLSTDEELAHGRRLEAIFHGHPSGIDPAAAALGTCFRFVRGEPPTITPLALARPLRMVIALDQRPRSTGAAVGGLRARWEADRARHERLFDDVAAVVEAGARAAAAGDLATLGEAFRANQVLLRELGVSAAAVEELVAAAEGAGALGAKLTGGGAGGAAIAVAAEPERVAATLRALGVRTIVVEIGAAEEAAA
ncbi:MAG TPA: mevalonate kinase [Candidatus Binatia bacterium]|nr:mevalonate kinase [Candidatus Binatia bacterium]